MLIKEDLDIYKPNNSIIGKIVKVGLVQTIQIINGLLTFIPIISTYVPGALIYRNFRVLKAFYKGL